MTVAYVYSDSNLVWKSLILLSTHLDSFFSYYCLAQPECEPERHMVLPQTSILSDYYSVTTPTKATRQNSAQI